MDSYRFSRGRIGVLLVALLSACSQTDDLNTAQSPSMGVSGAGGSKPGSTPAGSGMNPRSGGLMAAGSGGASGRSPQAGAGGGPGAVPFGGGQSGSPGAGSGGSAGSRMAGSAGAGSVDAGASGGADVTEDEDLGKGDGSDVVTIGDSYMQLSAAMAVEPSLERVADNDYRNYAQQGTRLIGGSNPIPGQYARAVTENATIATVVMTGGGNDVLQEPAIYSACSEMTPSQACLDAVPPLLDALSTLWEEMSEDGVRDVFLLTYPPAPAGTLAGGVRNFLPLLTPMLQTVCDAVPAPLRCHLLDAGAEFEATPIELRPDGIHPTDPGYALLAQFVYDAMVDAGARR